MTTWTSRERGRYDLTTLAARVRDSGALVHCCGPEGPLAGLETATADAGCAAQLFTERFTPKPVDHGPGRPFEVVLARSGRTLTVPADETLLDVVNSAGAGLMSTCREGTCGTCEARIVSGEADHRDSALTLAEQSANTTLMTCVSRCRGERLVLDL